MQTSHPNLGAQLYPDTPFLPQITAQTALFLDFDGTLVDIAPQPELVAVPADLIAVLGNLFEQLGGGLAIVTGRGLAELDMFLAPLVLPVAAEHGAVQRLPGGLQWRALPPDLHEVAGVLLALKARHNSLRVEIKSASVALHYRQAPELSVLCLDAMEKVLQHTAGVELLKGKCVYEIKMTGVSKGTAIQAFMAQAPFRGRVPVFAGDDTTDEAGFSAVQSIGGQGIKVGAGSSMAELHCASPADLFQWLHRSTVALKESANDRP